MTNKNDFTEIGVWFDEAFTKLDQKYVDELKKMNINTVAIMVNRSNTTVLDKPWVLRAKVADFERVSKILNRNKINICLTCWPQPNKAQIDALLKDMDDLIWITEAKAFEIDTESNWNKKFLGKEFKDLTEASEYLVAGMKIIKEKHNVNLQLTTFPYHQENGKLATVASYMDSLFPQAYSVANRDNGPVAWDSTFGPGKMQDTTILRTKQIPNFKGEICCGLAMYDQKWDGHTEKEALQKAIDKVKELKLTKIRYWSSKWIMNNKQNWLF